MAVRTASLSSTPPAVLHDPTALHTLVVGHAAVVRHVPVVALLSAGTRLVGGTGARGQCRPRVGKAGSAQPATPKNPGQIPGKMPPSKPCPIVPTGRLAVATPEG